MVFMQIGLVVLMANRHLNLVDSLLDELPILHVEHAIRVALEVGVMCDHHTGRRLRPVAVGSESINRKEQIHDLDCLFADSLVEKVSRSPVGSSRSRISGALERARAIATLCCSPEAMKIKELDYIQAARSFGASRWYILRRHIIPSTTHLLLISFSLLFIGAVKSEVILSYLGLGVKDEPSWGVMIGEAKHELVNGFFWQVGSATAFMFGLVLAFNILTDALQDAFDPKHQSG